MKCGAILLILVFFGFLNIPSVVHAEFSSCSGSVSPTSVNSSSTNDFSFSITNNSPDDSADWIRIQSPGGAFVIDGGSGDGWNVSIEDGDSVAIFTDGMVGPNETVTVYLTATTNSTLENGNWGVKLSNSGNGDGAIDCSGGFGASSTTSGGGGSSTITISDASLSASSTTATGTWITNSEGTSILEYGASDALGSSESSSTLTTSHSVTISGLTPSTTYHYRFKSVDAANNQAVTAIGTFTTSAQGSSETSTSTVSTSSTSKVTPTPTLPPDVTPPSVSVNYNFTKAVAVIPTIRGSVTDDRDISSIEYSIDGGTNWYKASFTPSSQKTISYLFTPLIKEDGNFVVLVRAKDKAGNTGVSRRNTLVFDRIPPKIGGVIVTSGPQITPLDSRGIMQFPAYVNHSLLFTSIGGAIDITVIATSSGKENIQKYDFKATKNPSSSVWSANMLFEKSGNYDVTIIALDGADNRTETKIAPIHILESGKIVFDGKGVKDAKVTVYTFDEVRHSFKEWKAESYLQKNPRKSSESGEYSFSLPKGKYYLSVDAKGYKKIKTNIFTLDKTTTINSKFELQKVKKLNLGIFTIQLPNFISVHVPLKLEAESLTVQDKVNAIVGQKVKSFILNSEDQKQTESIFKGKITIIGITNSFLPQTPVVIENLNIFKNAQKLVLFPHESDSYIQTYKKRGGYNATFLADPDGILLDFFKTTSLPSYVLIDEEGIVKKIDTGVFSNK